MTIDMPTIKEETERVGGKLISFSQSVITSKYRKRNQELYPGGICLALSVFYLSKTKGKSFNDLVVGVYTKDLDTAENEGAFQSQVRAIMGRQALIKKGESGKEQKHYLETFVPYVEWMKELGPAYGLELTAADTSDGAAAGVMAARILKSTSSFVLGFAGGSGGHAIAARNDGENIAFFDPNCGSFFIPSKDFQMWFAVFMFATGYQKSYGSFFTIAEFK